MDGIRAALSSNKALAESIPNWEETLVNPDSLVSLQREIIDTITKGEKSGSSEAGTNGPNAESSISESVKRQASRERTLKLELAIIGMKTEIIRKRARLTALKSLIDKQHKYLQIAKTRYFEKLDEYKEIEKDLQASDKLVSERMMLKNSLRSLEQMRQIDIEPVRNELTETRKVLEDKQKTLVEARINVINALTCLDNVRSLMRKYQGHQKIRGDQRGGISDREARRY